MKRICALAAITMLSACANGQPTPATMSALDAAVTAANIGEKVYVNNAHTTPANAAKAATALAALNTAWTSYQTAITAGEPGNTATLNAALAAVLAATAQ